MILQEINTINFGAKMEESFLKEDLKSRLLLSGLKELSEYGARDFSLRRAAESAGVSCAAPYRYFKGKEEYVAEIISYLSSRWELMASEILKSAENVSVSVFAELFVANLRFWVSHKSAASVFIISGDGGSLIKSELFGKSLSNKLYEFLLLNHSEDFAKQKLTALKALFTGYVSLVASGLLPNDEESFLGIKEQVAAFII